MRVSIRNLTTPSRTTYPHFWHNGKILPIRRAQVSLSNVEYSYGFGVYETIRVTKGQPYFAQEHCQRLLNSAAIIGLEHPFTAELVQTGLKDLIKRNRVEATNLKLMLIGGPAKAAANLYILCLNPLFPPRQLYKTGAHAITYEYEREFPHAKTLNMLPSYLAYRQARQAEAYDALLIDRAGNITEGTRTNFFAIKDKVLFAPPADQILLGVTRDKVLKVARERGFKIQEQKLPLADIDQYQGAFLTSTSSKIMPLRSINNHQWPELAPPLKELIAAFEAYLDQVNLK